MLTRIELTEIFDRLGTPDAGRQLIHRARAEAPVRKVRSSGGGSGSNVVTLLPSRKMQCPIATESRTLEFVGAHLHEYDDTILEYFPQPCKLQIRATNAAGNSATFAHTPDFLIIQADGFTLEEWKHVSKLERLAALYPHRYVREESGEWRSPLVEAYLADRGIRYRIVSDDKVPRRYHNNLLHLADYLDASAPPCPEPELRRLSEALQSAGALFIAELVDEPYNFRVDDLLKAIADRRAIADLYREQLTNIRNARIFRDLEICEFMAQQLVVEDPVGMRGVVLEIRDGARYELDGRLLTVQIAGAEKVYFATDTGEPFERSRFQIEAWFEQGTLKPLDPISRPAPEWSQYSPQDLAVACERRAILEDPDGAKVSERTLRSWQQREGEARVAGLDPLLALVPLHRSKGNRTSRLSEDQRALMAEIFVVHYSTSTAKNLKVCFHSLTLACIARDIPHPSYPTWVAYAKGRMQNRDLARRFGKRIAYRESTFVYYLTYDSPQHGSGPFTCVHIDHTEVDVELISHRTGESLGRPWLTLIIDAWSRRILGFYLSYNSPSHVSGLMALRDMVRRHNRLPQMVVTDNGSDLRGKQFTNFLHIMGVIHRFRPAGEPRHGAVMERIFGTANTQYFHNLAGNTKLMKEARSVSGKHLPKKLAQWSLECLYGGIDYWAMQYYNNEPHPALGCSPAAAFQRGLREGGLRTHKHIVYNRDFLILSCPLVEHGRTRVVGGQRGVKVGNFHFWHESFADFGVRGKSVEVREDPWDASSVYAWVKGTWVRARCRQLLDLDRMTMAMCKAHTAELGARFPQSEAEILASAKRLKEFMAVHVPEGARAHLFEQLTEDQLLYDALLGVGCVERDDPGPAKRAIQVSPQPAENPAPSAFPPEDDDYLPFDLM